MSRNTIGVVGSMRLAMYASATPGPPKLTVTAVRPGKVRSVQARISSGDRARSSAAADCKPTGVRIGEALAAESRLIASRRRG